MAVIRKIEKQNQVPNTLYIIDKKKGHEEHSDSNWIISYADMMTLLCIFFIMLFSMSKVNTPEFESMKKEMAEHFGTKYEAPTQDLGKFVNNVLIETGVAKDATMTSDGMSVSVAFHSTLFFDSMSAEISPAGKEIIEKVATRLFEHQTTNGKKYKIVIEGHTDSQPIVGGPFPTNWELSSGRATRVVRLFLDKKFDAQNLLAIGYADTQPVAEGKNPDGTWNNENLAKNRRVVLRVLLPEVDNIPWKINDGKGVSAPAAAPASASVSAPETTTTAVPVAAVPATSQAVAPMTSPEIKH